MQHFFLPSVTKRVDGYNGNIQFLSYHFSIACIKFFLYENNLHMLFVALVNQRLQLEGKVLSLLFQC